MKLVVREKVDQISEPVKKVFEIDLDPTLPFNAIPATIGLNKGDILVFRGDGDVAVLPVGSNGQHLVADDTAPLGVRWSN